MFLGFIAGIAAQDFDLERVYVDGLTKMVSLPLSSLEEMFSGLESFSVRSGIDVIIGANGDELPEYLKKYIAE